MLIAKLKNQLGNQMFEYAVVKTIAQKKGYNFAFYIEPILEKYINDSDKKHGKNINDLFVLEEKGKEKLPDGYNYFNESIYRKDSNFFFQESYAVEDDTIMDGLFESLQYFNNDFRDLRKWFVFHQDTEVDAKIKIDNIRKRYHNRVIVSVHFRVGDDFMRMGLTMNKKYWYEAAESAVKQYGNPIFVCFYDKKNFIVENFLKHFECIDCRGSLIEDMCMISMCDAHIICNSTFSIISALLDKKKGKVFCPQKYPAFLSYRAPEDVMLKEWTAIPCSGRCLTSFVCMVFQYVKKYFFRG